MREFCVHNERRWLYRSTLQNARARLLLTNRIFMHKGSFDFVLLSSSCGHFVTEKRSRAIHTYDASVCPQIRAPLFREVKDTSRGSCLKCIGSVLSNRFILAVLRRSGRTNSPEENGWASRSRGTIGHTVAVSKLQISFPLSFEHYAKKLKTVTRGN